MEKIITGIYGGSFNPIHWGHIRLADALCQKGCVDELWLMVSPQNPLKEQQGLLPEQQRLHLAELGVKDYPNIHVSDFEFHLPRPSYMIHTLQALVKAYPNRQFVLVIGADNWAVFHKWYHADEIIEQFSILIYPREGSVIDPTTLPPHVSLVNTPLINISSTEIREHIIRHADGSHLTPPAVWNEIMKEGLYQ